MNKKFDIIEFLQTRPFSWSAMSSWDWDKEQWYQKYMLGIKSPDSPELLFGKKFADSCEIRRPLAPVTLLSVVEHEFRFRLGDVPMIGYADTFDKETRNHTGEFKTGVKPWDQKRVDQHGQITMYALGNYLITKRKPEECTFFLEWIPTMKVPRKNNDYSGFDYDIAFRDKVPTPVHFETKRTTREALEFGVRVKNMLREMELYVRNHE